MTVVMLVTMVSIVHAKQTKHIIDTSVLEKEKGPGRTGGSIMTTQEINVSLSC